MTKSTAIAALALVIVGSGCVCFPFATPPMEVTGGIASKAGDGNVGMAAPLDITAKPAGAFTRLWDRRFDAGLGYRYVFLSQGPDRHGPTLQAGYLLPATLDAPFDGRSDLGLRFGYLAQSQLVVGNQVDELGFGATFRFTAEWVRFDNGPFDTCSYESGPDPGYQDLDGDGYDDFEDDASCSFGESFGELGLGLFAEASYLEVDTTSVGWVGFGLTLRVPAAAGIAVASIFD